MSELSSQLEGRQQELASLQQEKGSLEQELSSVVSSGRVGGAGVRKEAGDGYKEAGGGWS